MTAVRRGEAAALPLAMPAAGCGGPGPELDRFGPVAELSAVCIGPVGLQQPTATGDTAPPAPRTRIETVPGGIVAGSAPAIAVDEVVTQQLPWLAARGARAVIAVRGDDLTVLADVLGRLRRSLDFATVTGVEIDLTATSSGDPQHCLRALSRTREMLPRDVHRLAKLGMATADLIAASRHAVAGGATAIVVCGAVPAGEGRSLVGPAITPVTEAMVHQVLSAITQGRIPPVPVIASGGVYNLASAHRLIAAGATGLQLGSALFRTPELLWQLQHSTSSRDSPAFPTLGEEPSR